MTNIEENGLNDLNDLIFTNGRNGSKMREWKPRGDWT